MTAGTVLRCDCGDTCPANQQEEFRAFWCADCIIYICGFPLLLDQATYFHFQPRDALMMMLSEREVGSESWNSRERRRTPPFTRKMQTACH